MSFKNALHLRKFFLLGLVKGQSEPLDMCFESLEAANLMGLGS